MPSGDRCILHCWVADSMGLCDDAVLLAAVNDAALVPDVPF